MGNKTLRPIEPLEKDIEQSFVRWCKKEGVLAIKLYEPSYPDRLVLCKGTFIFIEFKRKGRILTANQRHIALKLRKLGFKVYVAHSKQEAIDALKDYHATLL